MAAAATAAALPTQSAASRSSQIYGGSRESQNKLKIVRYLHKGISLIIRRGFVNVRYGMVSWVSVDLALHNQPLGHSVKTLAMLCDTYVWYIECSNLSGQPRCFTALEVMRRLFLVWQQGQYVYRRRKTTKIPPPCFHTHRPIERECTQHETMQICSLPAAFLCSRTLPSTISHVTEVHVNAPSGHV